MPVSAVTSSATSKKLPAACAALPFSGSLIDAVLIADVTLEFELVQLWP
jgi:hypothetical protein